MITVETELVAAAPITFQKIWVQNLPSKSCVLLLRATVRRKQLLIPFLRYNLFSDLFSLPI